MGDKNWWLEDDRKGLNDMKDSRELLQPKVITEPANKAAVGVGEKLKDNGVAKAIAQKLVNYAQWVQSKPGERLANQHLPQPVLRANEAVNRAAAERLTPPPSEQDVEIQALKDKNVRIQEAIDRAKAPQDLGDIDSPAEAPAVRQPVQMSREFAATPQGQADREAYIREALKKARQ